ncbi:MAG: LLM class flavin-dependent oxidoreductase, partial [Bacteroidota bacterium]
GIFHKTYGVFFGRPFDYDAKSRFLGVDVTADSATKPSPIHLGFKSGVEYLKTHLELLESHGVNHVILNLKYGSRPADEVIEEIGENIVPYFS